MRWRGILTVLRLVGASLVESWRLTTTLTTFVERGTEIGLGEGF